MDIYTCREAKYIKTLSIKLCWDGDVILEGHHCYYGPFGAKYVGDAKIFMMRWNSLMRASASPFLV